MHAHRERARVPSGTLQDTFASLAHLLPWDLVWSLSVAQLEVAR